MANFSSMGDYAASLQRLSRELEREKLALIRQQMAEKAQGIAEREASSDLGGDPKFSGWAPTLDTRIKLAGDATILMPTRSSAGPWTVANDGRHANGGVGRFQGPGVNMRTGNTTRNRSGGVTARRRRGVRWNGVTRGKGTADRAVAIMERELRPIAERGVKMALRRHFDVT